MIGKRFFSKEFIRFSLLWTKAEKEDGVKIYTKDLKYKILWLAIHYILLIFTFGKMNKFYTKYTTTIGNKIFFPAKYTYKSFNSAYVTLKHELVHVKQFKQDGLLKMSFKYLFLPFPFKYAKYRYYYEREAYLESIKAILELDLEPNIEWYVDVLTGPEYVWAWHSKNDVKSWFNKQLEELNGQRTL